MGDSYKTIVATVIGGVILGSFAFGFTTILGRMDRIERQVVKVLDDHEMRLRVVEQKLDHVRIPSFN